MDKEQIKDKVLQWQLLAEQWFSENQNVFIKKLNGDINFCKIVLVGEVKITVDVYAPEQRAGKRLYIDWLEIEMFDKVREGERE
ncbi:MAG TPA: hypothetical protein VMZ91_08450 [Candidatus Paceibacterota bacterium]|nr:hypothetical protein [Candidatus Paceibacterota bacterium]